MSHKKFFAQHRKTTKKMVSVEILDCRTLELLYPACVYLFVPSICIFGQPCVPIARKPRSVRASCGSSRPKRIIATSFILAGKDCVIILEWLNIVISSRRQDCTRSTDHFILTKNTSSFDSICLFGGSIEHFSLVRLFLWRGFSVVDHVGLD